MTHLPSALRTYLVADPAYCRGDLITVVEEAISGGVTMVQLRAKRLSDADLFSLATRVRESCRSRNVPFLVNDRLDIALAVRADGVHLGVDDLPIRAARSVAGTGFFIGYSPDTDSQLGSAAHSGADYLGIGPVFSTATKTDAGSALGLDEFARRMRLGGLPAVAIGGITARNSASVRTTGAAGVAVVSAILHADDPAEAARQLSRNS